MVKDPELPLTGLSGFLQGQESEKTVVPRRASEPAGPGAVFQTAPVAGGVGTVGTPAQAPGSGEGPLVRNVLYLAGAAGVVLLAFSVFLSVKAKR
jgi:hypothetical protein